MVSVVWTAAGARSAADVPTFEARRTEGVSARRCRRRWRGRLGPALEAYGQIGDADGIVPPQAVGEQGWMPISGWRNGSPGAAPLRSEPDLNGR